MSVYGHARALSLRGFRPFVLNNRVFNRRIDIRNFVYSLVQDSDRDVVDL